MAFPATSTVCVHSATAENASASGTSWNVPGPSTCVCTCPVRASTGARSTFASQRPVRRFVAPGPAIEKHAAGRPVSLAYALAANAAAPSWRIPNERSRPSSSARRIASARPRLEWPTMPNTVSRPQSHNVSTTWSMSDTRSTGAGISTKSAPSRSSTR